ncbi:hypothetical protein DFH09DRAFT_1407275 [Mycena vulgaris]|nr:hypothetical protein DFH09DRAFT_1407275 [Mycena vulgaris]
MCSSSVLSALYLLFHEIASLGPLTTAIALSQCNSTLRILLRPHLQQSFEKFLSLRISAPNIAGFSTLLRETLAAISGSTVLHFALRDTHWTPGDLDIYAPFGTGFAIVDWLTRHEDYQVVSDGSKNFLKFHPHPVARPKHPELCDWLTELSSPRAPVPIHRVYKLHRASPSKSFIDVIESTRPSFLPPITKFHSTLVMNYLTPDALVLLYPAHTFARVGVLQFRDLDTQAEYDAPAPAVDGATQKQDYVPKYTARGFALYARPADRRAQCGAACPARVRSHPGPDSFALHLRFGAAGEGSAVRATRLRLDESLDGIDSAADAAPCAMPTRPAPKPVLWSLLGPPPPPPAAVRSIPISSLTRPPRGRKRTLDTCHNPYCPLRGQRRVLSRSPA